METKIIDYATTYSIVNLKIMTYLPW